MALTNAAPRQAKAADSDSDGGGKKRKRGAKKKKKVSCRGSSNGIDVGAGMWWDVYMVQGVGCWLARLDWVACSASQFELMKTKTHPAPCIHTQDPNAPKRPMTAFMLFTAAKRAEVKEEQPDLKVGASRY